MVEKTTGFVSTEGLTEWQRKKLQAAARNGELVRIRNGVYASPDALADTMVDIYKIVPDCILCLWSAWSVYGLTTQIPNAYHVAVEKKQRTPLSWAGGVFRLRRGEASGSSEFPERAERDVSSCRDIPEGLNRGHKAVGTFRKVCAGRSKPSELSERAAQSVSSRRDFPEGQKGGFSNVGVFRQQENIFSVHYRFGYTEIRQRHFIHPRRFGHQCQACC